MRHLYEYNNLIIAKIERGTFCFRTRGCLSYATNYLLCSLHGFEDAALQLKRAKNYIKNLDDTTTYVKFKEAIRVLRKVKYQ